MYYTLHIPLLPSTLLGRLDCIGISRAIPLEGMGSGRARWKRWAVPFSSPKGTFYSLWLTQEGHLKGSMKYHRSIHSAKAPSTEGQRGVLLQPEKGPCVSLDIIFPQDQSGTSDPAPPPGGPYPERNRPQLTCLGTHVFLG